MIEERVARWKALAEADARRAPHAGRWVVVDVETAGLDPGRDALLAVGAVGVRDGAVDLADSFEVVLRQGAPSGRENIALHGIAGGEQMGGADPRAGLADFLDFIGKDPLVAYHAYFDEAALARALKSQLGLRFRRRWLDLADVAPLAWPGRVNPRGGLDAWLEAFGIPMAFRHRAVVDCLATAQLLLAVLHAAPRLRARTAADLLALSGQRRWL